MPSASKLFFSLLAFLLFDITLTDKYFKTILVFANVVKLCEKYPFFMNKSNFIRWKFKNKYLFCKQSQI
ncbi:hypothetical protein HMPREF3034_00867 [Prevotella sp. DNF00663]|nr:hypothetical protein HMPREF3034_00867 [Prevotella sp. DNF00663]